MVVFLIPKKLAHLFNHISDKVIDRYREDADLKDMIDYAQINFQCCGLGPNGYKDWSSNEYFNCTPTNLSAEKCAVPYSCCRNASTLDVRTLTLRHILFLFKKDYLYFFFVTERSKYVFLVIPISQRVRRMKSP